jgi:hypothetical protein
MAALRSRVTAAGMLVALAILAMRSEERLPDVAGGTVDVV